MPQFPINIPSVINIFANQPNGIATLDSSSKLPSDQLQIATVGEAKIGVNSTKLTTPYNLAHLPLPGYELKKHGQK